MSFSPDSPFAQAVFASPNRGARIGDALDMLILHYTGMPTAQGALERLCDPAAEVSAHYFVFEDGRIVQMVPEADRAWHAGAGAWAGARDINSRSIGIEIAHPGHAGGLPPYPEAQIAAVIGLARDIVVRRGIPAPRILAHSDVAPAPVRDGRFLAMGETGQPVEALQAMLALYGYEQPVTGHFDEGTRAAVTAFQRHFRPARIDGVADSSTITTLRDLIAAQPA